MPVSSVNAPEWTWDPSERKWFCYDPRRRAYRYEDGKLKRQPVETSASRTHQSVERGITAAPSIAASAATARRNSASSDEDDEDDDSSEEEDEKDNVRMPPARGSAWPSQQRRQSTRSGNMPSGSARHAGNQPPTEWTQGTSTQAQEARTLFLYYDRTKAQHDTRTAALRTAHLVNDYYPGERNIAQRIKLLQAVLPGISTSALRELSKIRDTKTRTQSASQASDGDSDGDEEAVVPVKESDVRLPLTYATLQAPGGRKLQVELLLDSGATHDLLCSQALDGLDYATGDGSVGYMGMQKRIRGSVQLECRLAGGLSFIHRFYVVDELPYDAFVCYSTIKEFDLFDRDLPYHPSRHGGMQLNAIEGVPFLGVKKSKTERHQQMQASQNAQQRNAEDNEARERTQRHELAARRAAYQAKGGAATSSSSQGVQPTQTRR